VVSGIGAAATDDVQRQLQQREQRQTELRLKMQQQRDRATQPLPSPSSDLERRLLERDQQQRLRQLHEQQSRSGVAPSAAGEMQRESDRQRYPQAASEQLKRFEYERQREIERSRSDE
jgi:hypothetical protein